MRCAEGKDKVITSTFHWQSHIVLFEFFIFNMRRAAADLHIILGLCQKRIRNVTSRANGASGGRDLERQSAHLAHQDMGTEVVSDDE